MLATLNLQLSPVELLDDSTLTPVSLQPGDTGEAASGFADLLRLRVDASTLAEDAGGELLPQGGSGLPISAELDPPEIPAELLPMADIDAGLVKLAPEPIDGEGLAALDETSEILLETLVLYPPLNPTAGAEAEPLTAPPILAGTTLPPAELNQQRAQPEVAAEGRTNVDVDTRLRLNGRPVTPIPAPLIDGREGRAQNPATEAGVLTAASMGLRERGQHSEPGNRATPITVANTILDGEDRSPLTDFARRFELTPLQRAEPGTDAVQPRIAVAQATQALQSQINPQPSQPTLSLAAAAPADTSYAALAQQSTDLIGTSVRDSAWGEKVGDRVVMMAANQLKQAEIRLTPAELGPLRVRVSVEDGNTHVTFHAQHAVTREALEQALPRLREMLAENGLSLGQADVSDRGVNDSGREQDSDGSAANLGADDANDVALEVSSESSRRVSSSNGLVDTFA
jgi:hypothetical protein